MVGLGTFEQMAGGSARYLSGLSAGLQRDGHIVEVRTAADHVPTVGYAERGPAGQLRRLVIRLLIAMPRSFWAVLSRPPDLVNVHFALDGLPAVVAAAIRRVPVVVTFHGPWATEAISTGRRGGWPLSTTLRRTIERSVYRRAQRCVVLSDSFGSILRSMYGVNEQRIKVIPGGLDTGRFANVPRPAEARRQLGLPDCYTIATVRRLVPRMGIDLAIDALARITTRLDAVLLIAGSGPERDILEQHVRNLGLERRVRFLGRVPDEQLPLVYAAADVCVVPSRALEGFGFVALEALASGTPVIATDTGGLRELVGGLEERWVVARDAGAIATAIENVLDQPGAYPDGAACRRYAATLDWGRILPSVVEVFREAIADISRSTAR